MIISKTPLRIPFFSGGTDIPAFYKKEMGQALSATIDKYVYVGLHRHTGDEITVNGATHWHDDKLTREVLNYFGITKGLSINYTCDINRYGTGLGASSAYVVGLVNAICRLREYTYTPESLAQIACEVEIEKCKAPIGKQDQYAAAYGGFNMFYFHPSGLVSRAGYTPPNEWRNNFYLIDSGIFRNSSDTIVQDIDENKRILMRKGIKYAEEALEAIQRDDRIKFVKLLRSSWETKKKSNSAATTSEIDKIFERLTQSPEVGGKILGAGGGGFMLFYSPAFSALNASFFDGIRKLKLLTSVPFRFTNEGSKIILDERRE